MPRKQSQHRKAVPIIITPIDPMEGYKIAKGLGDPELHNVRIDPMISSMMNTLNLKKDAREKIEAIKKEKSDPVHQINWWKATRCEAGSDISAKKICSYVYQDTAFRNLPTEKDWKFLVDAHRQMQALGEVFQIAQDGECKQSTFFKNNSFEMHIFGGTLAFGFWDGKSDIDFCYISPDAIENWKEESFRSIAPLFVRNYAKFFRKIGFRYGEIIPILDAKVPIIKHKKRHFSQSNLTVLQVDLLKNIEKDVTIKSIATKVNLKLISESVCKHHVVLQFVSLSLSNTRKAYEEMKPIALQIRQHIFEPFKIAFIDFDLSFCPRGLRNSWLLRAYLMQNDIARQGAFYLKRWSKTARVNDSSKGYLCSYAYVILWIYFLTFEKKKLCFVAPESIPKIPQNNTDCSTLFQKFPEIKKRDQTLGVLLYEFFTFYTSTFDWSINIVSLQCMKTRKDIQWEKTRLKNEYFYLCIEDPYVDNRNLARALDESRASETIHAMNIWKSEVHLHAKCTALS